MTHSPDKRVSVTFTEEALAGWKAQPRTTPGGQRHYSDLAIETALTLRAVFRLALRQSEGLIGLIMRMLNIDLPVPDHTTLSRRASGLPVHDHGRNGTGELHLIVDSTGLKLRGAGEWLFEKHGTAKRRSWRKLTWGDLGQECLDAVGHKQNSCRDSFGIQGLSLLTRPGYSLARSNSHSVAARGGCTNIPLAAGEAQEDETILKFGGSSHTGFRSVRPDPPGLIMSWKIREYCERLPSSHFHHGSFDNDAGGDIFPQRH